MRLALNNADPVVQIRRGEYRVTMKRRVQLDWVEETDRVKTHSSGPNIGEWSCEEKNRETSGKGLMGYVLIRQLRG